MAHIQSPRLRTVKTRLGLVTPLLLSASSLGIILATSGLIYLWSHSYDDQPSSVRSHLALTGWTVPIITVCGAVIQICITTQLGAACAMVATLSFEHGWILFQDAAAISLWRFAGGSPFNLVFPFFEGMRIGRKYLGLYLVVQLVAVTMFANVISTILTRDTGVAFISANEETIGVKYDAFRFGLPRDADPFSERPLNYPLFAERRLTDNVDAVERDGLAGLSDYGPTYRAFLPLSRTDRESLLYYDGLARLVDSHVMCLAPTVERLTVAPASPDPYDPRPLVVATLSALDVKESLEKAESRRSFRLRPSTKFNFSCIVFADREYHLCAAGTPSQRDATTYPPSKSSLSFPSVNAIDDWNTWWVTIRASNEAINEEKIMFFNNTLAKSARFNGSEWSQIALSRDHSSLSFNISLCVTSFRYVESIITIVAGHNLTEPITPVIPGLIPTYDSSALLWQLNGPPSQTSSRGTFNITQFRVMSKASAGPARTLWHRLRTTNAAVRMERAGSPEDKVHPVYGGLFADLVAERANQSRPARALQSIMTVLSANMYYAQLESLDGITPATVRFSQPVVVPVKIVGLCLVIGIIMFHLLSSGLTTWLFFKGWDHSPKLLDQAWYTIAQVQAGKARNFLSEVTDEPDDEVKFMLGKEGTKVAKLERGNNGIGIVPTNSGEMVDPESNQ